LDESQETLPLDVSLGASDKADTTFLGGTTPLKFGRAKKSKVRCELGQLWTLTANVSGTHRDTDKQKMALSTAIHLALNFILTIHILRMLRHLSSAT